MAANTAPIFSALGSVQWTTAPLLTGNTAKDGTGTVAIIATGNASGNAAGNFIQRLVARAMGANAATVLRVFINNGGAMSLPANNSLIAEMTLPLTTATEVAAQPDFVLPLNLALPPGYRLACTLGTTVAAGYQVTAIGGQY